MTQDTVDVTWWLLILMAAFGVVAMVSIGSGC